MKPEEIAAVISICILLITAAGFLTFWLIQEIKDKKNSRICPTCNGRGRIQNDQCNKIHNQSDQIDR